MNAKDKVLSFLKSIRNKIILLGIRLKSFYKNHKIASSAFVLFLFVGIVASVILLADEAVELKSASLDTSKTRLEIATSTGDRDYLTEDGKVLNFTTLDYNLRYYLTNGNICSSSGSTDGKTYYADKVQIKATIDANAIWQNTDETTSSTVSEDGKTLMIYADNVNLCSDQNQVLSLTILNEKQNTNIKPNISFKVGSENNQEVGIDKDSVKEVQTKYTGSPITLTAKINDGVVKTTDKKGKFGILLGFSSPNENLTSLAGKYINNFSSIFLDATANKASIDLASGTLEDNASSNNDFGVYTSDKKIFSSSKIPELRATSGTVKSLNREETAEESTLESAIESYKFLGQETLEYDRIPNLQSSIVEDSIRLKDKAGNIFECTTNNNCIISKSDILQNSSDGDYYIKYVMQLDNNRKITFKRKVTIKQSDNQYLLTGPKNIIVTTTDFDSIVDRLSIISPTSGTNINMSFYDKDSDTARTEAYLKENPGEYVQKYMVDGAVVGTRNIKIVAEANLPEIVSSEEVSVKDVTMTNTYNYEETSCSGKSDCSVTYDNGSSSLNKTPGTHTATVKITKSNYEIEIKKNIYIRNAFYTMLINSLSYSNELTKIGDFYAIGSYFVSTNKIDSLTNDTNVCLSASTSDDFSNVTPYCVNASASATGTNNLESEFYVVENGAYTVVDSSQKTDLSGNYYTAAMGEEVILKTKFDYGYDADNTLKTISVKIPVDSHLKPISYFDTVTAGKQFIDCEIVDGNGNSIIGSPTYDVKYYSGTTEIDPIDYKDQSISYIMVNISNVSIEPGANVVISTKYQVRIDKSIIDSKDITTNNFKNSGTEIKTDNTSLATQKNATPVIYITPYKVRSVLKFGKLSDSEDDTLQESTDMTFDASKNDTYTGALFTSVVSPALDISSNAFGYNTISSLKVVVQLPQGINYVYNKNYKTIEPVVTYNSGRTILTYTYIGVEPNAWIEPLYFDFNIDVSANTSDIIITSQTGDFTTKTIKNDISSSSKYKTKGVLLSIKNTQDVSYGQYLYNESKSHYVSNVDKNENFVQSIKFHNNTTNSHNDLYAYVIVPHEIKNDTSTFNGTFDIELPTISNGLSEVMCTNTDPSNLTKSGFVFANQNNSEVWTSCDSYKTQDNKYSGMTGVRLKYSSLSTDINADFKYTIKDNNPADIYDFDTYFTVDNNQTYSQFHKISLEVVSKKITGNVFEDFTVNGIMDESETKIEGVILKLYNASNDTLVATTTSDEKGSYMFSGLEEGTYYVVAEFDRERYGLTTQPSADFYDKTRINVFREDKTIVETPPLEDLPTDSDVIIDDNETSDSNINDNQDSDEPSNEPVSIIRSNDIVITSETRIYRYVNLGLSLRKIFNANINKYVSKVEVTDALGVKTIKNYGNVKLAKLDVRDMSKVKIKVTYTLEIQNIKYYPGYVNKVAEVIPFGMTFNKSYPENAGWELTESGILENKTIGDTLLKSNDKKYLTISYDITSKEAGSFINVASIDDLRILGGDDNES